MRMIIVGGLLTMALLGAVLGAVRLAEPASAPVPDEFKGIKHEITDHAPASQLHIGYRG